MTEPPECSIDGCTNPSHVKGWCNAHYLRNYRHGSPLGGGPPRDTSFEEKMGRAVPLHARQPDACWEWQGTRGPQGYGIVCLHNQPAKQAHRLSYAHFVGPIPDGMLVLHSCDNPPCVNPAHLRVGTYQDNMNDRMLRGDMSNMHRKRGKDGRFIKT